jgi:hypothetical protein
VGKWCTVTVIDPDGKRHSMDVQADSTYDAAHVYVATAKSQQAAMLPGRAPVPTLATVFEVVCDAKVYRVEGAALERWIVKRRGELKGPKGQLFKQRAMLEYRDAGRENVER